MSIGYDVDPELKRNTYAIIVNNINFQTPSGSSLLVPSITVPVEVNRWAVANEDIKSATTKVWGSNNTLNILAEKDGSATIYNLNGQLVKHIYYKATEMASTNLSTGLYIVGTSEGKVVKIMMGNNIK